MLKRVGRIAVSTLTRDTISIERPDPDTKVKGEVVSSVTNTTIPNVNALVTPANIYDLRRVGINNRAEKVIKIITATQVAIPNQDSLSRPDVIIYNGDRYKVVAVEPYEVSGFYRIFAGLE